MGSRYFILTLIAACCGGAQELGDALVHRLGRLLGVLAAAVLYFTAVQHLTNLYAAEHAGVERFILLEGGVYTAQFWLGQIFFGSLVPMLMLFTPRAGRVPDRVALASALIILGGFAQVYVIVIGGQAYPVALFPVKAVRSSFFDGVIMTYVPSPPEIALGVGGVALAAAIVLVGLRILRILPTSLADAAVDPHQRTAATSTAEKAPA